MKGYIVLITIISGSGRVRTNTAVVSKVLKPLGFNAATINSTQLR